MIPVLYAAAPWLIGFLIFYKSSLALIGRRADAVLFGCGGGVYGYLLVALLYAWHPEIVNNPVSSYLAMLVFAILVLCAVYVYRLVRHAKSHCAGDILTAPTYLVAIYCLLFFGGQIYVSLLLPAFGWDALSFWVPISLEYINYELQWPQISEVVKGAGTHPHTLARVSAWLASAMPPSSIFSTGYAAWPLLLATLFLSVCAYSYVVTDQLLISMVVGLCCASAPLITNHGIIGGYGELFLAVTFVLATAISAIGVSEKRAGYLVFSFLLCLTCMTYKNVGVFYSVMLCFIILISTVIRYELMSPVTVINLIVVTILLTAVFATYVTNHDYEIFVGSRAIALRWGNLLFVPRNELHSLILNQSFSVTPVILLLLVPICARCQAAKFDAQMLIPVVAWFAAFLFIIASQITDYGMRYAVPWNDTGNSRFSIVFIATSYLMVAPCYAFSKNMLHYNKTIG